MPWFTCETCNDSIKKPKLVNHFNMCSGYYFSCVDCLQTFDRQNVQFHTACVTEYEKYALGATKPGGQYSATTRKSCSEGGAPEGLQFLTNNSPWRCNLCNVPCTSRETLMAHAAGQKHKRKVRAATGQSAAGGFNGNATEGQGPQQPAVRGAAGDKQPAAAQAEQNETQNANKPKHDEAGQKRSAAVDTVSVPAPKKQKQKTTEADQHMPVLTGAEDAVTKKNQSKKKAADNEVMEHACNMEGSDEQQGRKEKKRKKKKKKEKAGKNVADPGRRIEVEAAAGKQALVLSKEAGSGDKKKNKDKKDKKSVEGLEDAGVATQQEETVETVIGDGKNKGKKKKKKIVEPAAVAGDAEEQEGEKKKKTKLDVVEVEEGNAGVGEKKKNYNKKDKGKEATRKVADGILKVVKKKMKKSGHELADASKSVLKGELLSA